MTEPLSIQLTAETPPPPTSNSMGMLFACWSIIIVIAAMFFVFMRARKKDYALAVLPLLLVPLMHILSAPLARLLRDILPLTFTEIRAGLDTIAALFSCLLIGTGSRRISGKRPRRAFFICCAGFIIILTLVLTTNILIASRV